MNKNFALKIILILLITHNIKAVTIEPQSYGSEKRLKYTSYHKNAVVKYTGFVGIPSYIEFENGENINTILTGMQDKWQFEVKGPKLFLKPLTEEGNMLMTIITNKRTYYFELRVAIASGPFDPRIAFGLMFKYPSEDQTGQTGNPGETTIIQYNNKEKPNLSQPDKYNFNYTMSGSDIISPVKVFDDGTFTYLEFKDKNATLPAVFGVDENGYEQILNFRYVGDYMIIESIFRTLTLRNGSDIVCLFNESLKQGFSPKKSVNR